jgi:hypothetical protein
MVSRFGVKTLRDHCQYEIPTRHGWGTMKTTGGGEVKLMKFVSITVDLMLLRFQEFMLEILYDIIE